MTVTRNIKTKHEYRLSTNEMTKPTVALDNSCEPEAELMPGVEIGEYIVRRKIASGGFSIVYEAVCQQSGLLVAIKILRAALATSTQTVARFLQEARAINLIDHPNIVKILDFGQLPDGRLYCVMEFLDGPTLSTILTSKRRFRAEETLEFFVPVGEALAAAHAAKFVHRDIKASNIATAVENGVRIVKLLDFGVAKMLDAEPGQLIETHASIKIGTPTTQAPEQIVGGKLGPATDIYALGVLLFRLLTGRYPFYAPDSREVERMHLVSPPPRPSELAPVDAAVEAVVMRCLEKAPGARYQSVDAFLDALRTAVRVPQKTNQKSAQAFAVFISIEPQFGDDDYNDEFDDAAEALIEDARRQLEGAGFQVMLATASTVLCVQPAPESRHQLGESWHQNIAIAQSIYDRAKRQAGQRIHCAVVVRCDTALVRTSVGGVEVIGGDVLELSSWLPETPLDGVDTKGAPSFLSKE
ncbi:MAG: serine/threonine protein kinase [Proteobacteria bacterium]|nr:serine/threonine protein kinase [Pseudomonadota bacterium]